MVALKREREQRHYPMGPLKQDVPLKVFDENAADLAENQARLRSAKSWWPERLLFVLAGVVFVVWMWGR
jgi:hypothetical protein